MHELSVIDSIIKVVLDHAQKNDAKNIAAVHLRVGELSDLQDEWMQRYFDMVSKNTIAEGALLKIERAPAIMKCAACAEEYKIDVKDLDGIQCPKCGEKKGSLISGREYFIKSMEII